jgi:hypothetical protein
MKTILILLAVSFSFSAFAGRPNYPAPAGAPVLIPAPAEERGTGLIHVECEDAAGSKKIVNTNRLEYVSGKLFATGFGPNRQDDGFEELTGTCSAQPRKPQSCTYVRYGSCAGSEANNNRCEGSAIDMQCCCE